LDCRDSLDEKCSEDWEDAVGLRLVYSIERQPCSNASRALL
jgi:hypothetical protein